MRNSESPPGTSFRSPELGDTIQTTTPTRIATPYAPAGKYLKVTLNTKDCVEEARYLVASRRWCVLDKVEGST